MKIGKRKKGDLSRSGKKKPMIKNYHMSVAKIIFTSFDFKYDKFKPLKILYIDYALLMYLF